ncbi:macrolide transport system ATP-binding/permease protein [Nonomuraea thailandensis]|uniref:Macrolide transport system ATP-binding/permease protein n=2 Tax=Nonomuraea thailandensis TaxID=1188745 RepID=A0A9X2GX58_9ACTN|nr:macrolide transport system ATP-binding/permease protein [Nonomuraea thailandensis]
MRLLAGVERPDDGEVRVSGDVGYLGQTLGLPPTHTVQQAVDAALAGLRAMERRMRELESALTEEVMDEYGELLTAYELRGGYEADARVDRAFHGLGLAHVGRERRLSSLSGGEQARLGLACVLAAAPRVLLLDEPTNHLDEPALTWLEGRLREHRGAVAVVSHDRVFLDRVATAVVEVEHGSATRFGGGYTGFLAAKAAARARWEQAYAAWREEVRQVREHASTTAHRVAAGRLMRDNNKMAYDRNAGRVQSSVAARVRNAHERLRRLEADPVPRPPAPLRFHGTFGTASAPGGPDEAAAAAEPATPHGGAAGHAADGTSEGMAARGVSGGAAARVLVELRDLRVGDRLRIESLTIRQGERLLVRGANGAGKSTLLQALADRADCRVGHLPQEVTFDPGQSVLEAYGEGYADERRAMLLNTGLFRAHTLDQKVSELSVGQRRRLALARLLAREHDLLLLDEPTNHLSPVLAEELERALDAYRGALVLVSHDRALVRRFRGAEIELAGGRLR